MSMGVKAFCKYPLSKSYFYGLKSINIGTNIPMVDIRNIKSTVDEAAKNLPLPLYFIKSYNENGKKAGTYYRSLVEFELEA